MKKKNLFLTVLIILGVGLFASIVYYRYYVPDKTYKCIDGQVVYSREVMLALNKSSFHLKSLECDEKILDNRMTEYRKQDVLDKYQHQIDVLEESQK